MTVDKSKSKLAQAAAEIGSGWEKSWQLGKTSFDKGAPPPALVKLVAEGRVPNGRALVPGCDGGHDLTVLASPSRFALGLEISPTAVIKARGTLQSNSIPDDQAAVIEADFFTFTEADLPALIASTPASGEPAGAPQFDAMFDYTFMCSFPPSWRRLWATRTAELIKPGGMLITLMGPLTTHRGGPPYSVSVELYRALLKDAFDEEEVSECESLPRCEGLEKLGVWRRKMTATS
ncbi:hypothetical protein AMAG_09994 [Allomyces macrogynus ATCC 38327]|uniref:Thiopurine S-methyltransferase n=1 Tax=Allomyces macrogynus (strain ATCC 38327) TaxID=578462 RepID=A0A0L0SQ56_ALLM3|nr:hypothetical protein AMAG_09994 [Allomyces macrogynus ATCC 38327]|eukprot:KNE64637.1 hypothetical protein AMAG_09994 [Allomyces macrogynus ATCC 38327]